MIRALERIDEFLIICMIKFRGFYIEWFSWTQRGFERTMIGIYVASSLGYALKLRYMLGLIVIVVTIVSISLWHDSNKSDWERLRKLMDQGSVFFRVFAVFLTIFITSALLGLPPYTHILEKAVGALPMIAQTMFHYSTSIPDGGHKRGRKRKLAADKLKEMFGSWLPLPEGNHA